MAVEEISSTDNSPTDAGMDAAWIEKGVVSNVDLKNFTVDVVSEYTSKEIPQVQIMHPYFHTYGGEGIFFMPEVGSIVYVCFPSDNDPPFVMGFIGSFEREGAKQDNLEDRAGEVANETEELVSELKGSIVSPGTTASSGSAIKKEVNASARAGRPFLNPGDIMMQTRDKNFLVLRRGGVLQLGATPSAQTIYVPLLNYIRHFAENYEVNTPGGLLEWVVKRQEVDPAGEAPCLWRLAVRDKAQNDKADVQLQVGHVGSLIRYQLEVSPSNVKVSDGSVVSPSFKMTIDTSGNQIVNMNGRLTYDIKGGRSVSILGSDELTITGSRKMTVSGNVDEEIAGTRTVKAAVALETYTGARTVKALLHTLGPPPLTPAVLGVQLVSWLAAHVALGPHTQQKEQLAQLNAILSKRLMIPL